MTILSNRMTNRKAECQWTKANEHKACHSSTRVVVAEQTDISIDYDWKHRRRRQTFHSGQIEYYPQKLRIPFM
ncbi:hypothetical protein L218DRAFT_770719 [Marasmius fiardii PR-910]|nr:hypothetical protein L218DRAFT_770719 [Marasmius fiardii PR-910]